MASTATTPPTVYIGSFDGNIYALNAKNGEPRWSRSAGGQVVGSLSAIGNIVYVAEFTHATTYGFDDAAPASQVFRYKTGTYTPVISDGRRIYLVGYSSINALRTDPAAGAGGWRRRSGATQHGEREPRRRRPARPFE